MTSAKTVVSRKTFEEARDKMKEGLKALQDLQDAEEETYGFTHNDADQDFIIDTVDYGSGGCSYEKYLELMKQAKKEWDRKKTVE